MTEDKNMVRPTSPTTLLKSAQSATKVGRQRALSSLTEAAHAGIELEVVKPTRAFAFQGREAAPVAPPHGTVLVVWSLDERLTRRRHASDRVLAIVEGRAAMARMVVALKGEDRSLCMACVRG